MDFNLRAPYGQPAIGSLDWRALGVLQLRTHDGAVVGFTLPAPFDDLSFTRGEQLTLGKFARLKAAIDYFRVRLVVTPKT